ncbi:STAS domain-containing protein [Streptomyces sp. ATE26]|uniref:STAS domain-containing protein n=1 Tax=unclassified Streptomyces TaxID=2593676 RepID=UPI00116B0CF4|nr:MULTISPECIES: STAS domain-containing protein [unclassified Streptomyces]MDI1453505.1 STAS domain-containing protein [Streptomyces sp. ATE26]GEK00351.1 anti-sigma factor antagonist [Streptomyces sp. 1-11]
MDDLTVIARRHPEHTVITVAGELDLETCPVLAQAAFAEPLGGMTLHLELSGVSFMDSSGLNLLLQLHQRLDGEGGRLLVSGLQDQPARVLHLTGAYAVLVADTAELSPAQL